MTDTINIMNEEVPVRRERWAIDDLFFLPDNPRVYAAIQGMTTGFSELTPDEQQKLIYECMCKEPSVANLRPEIERDGGLQEPVIVRYDTRQVIEGNSRLAAYHILRDKNPGDERWMTIDCLMLKDLTDEQQTRLLGQAHLHGKTDWSPHAKALYCYRWVKEGGKDAKALSEISGIKTQEINTSIRIIEMMKDNYDKKTSNFSYYDVLVRNRKISTAIDENEKLRTKLLADTKDESNPYTAQQMRDKLPAVIDKPRILKKFIDGEETLENAHERARVSDLQKKLKGIHDRLQDIEPNELDDLERNDLNAAEQIAKKISRETRAC